MKYSLFFLIIYLLSSCQEPYPEASQIVHASLSNTALENAEFLDKDYWYSGKAEVSKYNLTQNRYREVHNGEVILIFVTEDFLTDKQVKNDHYTNNNSVPILKTNQLRRFTTGLYDYSIMTSVFTRTDGSGTEKITLSSQDWCGQSYTQVNRIKGTKYKIQLRSYFESEGDQEVIVQADLLEDELMNKIRIDPNSIPIGKVKVLPSMVYSRLAHKELGAQEGIISMSEKNLNGTSAMLLKLEFPEDQRKVTITYEKTSPHKIISFEEEYPSSFDQKLRKTSAVKLHEIHDAYWKMNRSADNSKRSELNITGF